MNTNAWVFREVYPDLPVGGDVHRVCCFHRERTASLMIHIDKGNFYCFGCGTKGDVYDFYAKYKGVTRAVALAKVARLMNNKSGEDRQRQTAMRDFNAFLKWVRESYTLAHATLDKQIQTVSKWYRHIEEPTEDQWADLQALYFLQAEVQFVLGILEKVKGSSDSRGRFAFEQNAVVELYRELKATGDWNEYTFLCMDYDDRVRVLSAQLRRGETPAWLDRSTDQMMGLTVPIPRTAV